MSDDAARPDGLEDLKPATLAVRAGEDAARAHRATQVPIVYSAAFGYPDVDSWVDAALGRAEGHIYTRNTNPTVAAFEEKVRILEGAEAATSFSTGMAAVSNTLFALLAPGDRVVSVKDTYGGTNQMFVDFLPRWGVEVELCDTSDFAQIEAAIAEGCRLVYLETPTNPTLKVMDIARLSAAAHEAGAIVVADNTFATPINQNPLALGTDLVLHSATKFLGGHADALGGVLCGPPELIKKVYHYREITGASMDPMAAFLMVRSLKTLAIRVQRQNENAMTIATLARGAAAGRGGQLPGPRDAPAPRRRRASDAWLRRHDELLARAAASTPSNGCCRACSSRTSPPTSARWRRSPACRRPRATSSAPPRSARRWASPRGSCATRSASRTPAT